jgi:hypothetical protein
VRVGDSIDIAGGVKGPVGIKGAVAEFAIPTADTAEISSAIMNVRTNAVFFIQQQVPLLNMHLLLSYLTPKKCLGVCKAEASLW